MSAVRRLELVLEPAALAVVRLPADAPVPAWAGLDAPTSAAAVSVTRTAFELSIVAPAERFPPDARAEGPFRACRVRGALDFAQVGVIAALAAPLAAAGIPIFVLSTFDTDVLLVPADRIAAAVGALEAAGHRFVPA